MRIRLLCTALASLIAAASLTVVGVRPISAAEDGNVAQRLTGSTPVDEAIGVSLIAFPTGAEVAFVAGTGGIADALSSASLDGGPLLLVPPSGAVPEAVLDEIGRLSPRTIVILGGTAVVGSDIEAELAATGMPVRRVAGADRHETSAAVASTGWPSGADRVYLARDDVAVDALSAGSLDDGPVLLANAAGHNLDGLRQTIDSIAPDEVVALGGTAAVPEWVLQEAATGRPTGRLAGMDRYDTAAAIVDASQAAGASGVVLASSNDPMGALIASTSSLPVLPLPACGSIPDEIAHQLARLSPAMAVVVGDASDVCDDMLAQVADAAGAALLESAYSVEGSAYRTRGEPWDVGEVRWSLDQSSTDLARDIQVREIERSFAAWSNVTPLTFRQVSPSDANIHIGFFSGCDPWGRCFDDRILGWGNLGRDGEGHAYISFNDAFVWTTASLSGRQQYLRGTVMHEIGHALGIDHPCEGAEPGCESYRGGSLPSRYQRQVMWWQAIEALATLASDDVAAAQSLYGDEEDDEPVGSLAVSFTENPFTCDGGLRWFGEVSGAAAGERVTFASPELGSLAPGTASSGGTVAIRWQCNPNEAGQSWTVTAQGQSSGRSVTFTVSGVGPVEDSPPPPAHVTIAKGASYRASWCTHSSCARVNVSVSGFAPNATITYSCFSSLDGSAFYTTTVRTDGAGNGFSAVCVFGYPNRQVWVVAEGVRSNTLTWS